MGKYTNELNLYQTDMDTDGNDYFNFKRDLDDNWEKIDDFAANVNTNKADKSVLLSHTTNTSNPHGVTKSQVGLSNVDNTSDLKKPISTAMQTALNSKTNTDLNNLSIAGEARFTAKANTDLSNCTKPYVTETMQNDVYWYRLYSDGFCEQGGVLWATSGTVTFTKAYKNTRYNVQTTIWGTPSGSDQAACALTNNTSTNQFTIHYNARNIPLGTVSGVTWRTSGYCW